jgi:hypothetical protein
MTQKRRSAFTSGSSGCVDGSGAYRRTIALAERCAMTEPAASLSGGAFADWSQLAARYDNTKHVSTECH